MVTVEVDPRLSVSIEEGDEAAYSIEIVYDGDAVTQYWSNADPWSESGQTMLGNIVARRLEAYDREDTRRLLARAYLEHEPAIEEAFG